MVAFASRRFAFSVVSSLLLAVVALTAMTDSAEARRRKRPGYSPPYASIIIDVNSGKMLEGTNPDAPRFPASVTKVMTLYMLFEQMERGRFRPDTPLTVSAFAARQAPSKIGFDPGETIEVDEAIRALVTKSANDVAVVVAEAVGGDQETFAEMMTAKARALGMSRTTFKNASG
ncbi:MAG: D-alanyl-D-alanine carboxypeptidase family protein, partial [Beijerinckiaceae bacterium]